MTIDEILLRVAVEVDPHVARLKEGSTGMALVQLGAEVRRLRELVARVAALPDKWKGRIIGDDWTGAALQLEAALNDAARRLERVHDEADKYQVRALDAEAEVRRLRGALVDKLVRADVDKCAAKLANVADIRDELRDHQDRSPVDVDTIVEMLTEALEDEP